MSLLVEDSRRPERCSNRPWSCLDPGRLCTQIACCLRLYSSSSSLPPIARPSVAFTGVSEVRKACWCTALSWSFGRGCHSACGYLHRSGLLKVVEPVLQNCLLFAETVLLLARLVAAGTASRIPSGLEGT